MPQIVDADHLDQAQHFKQIYSTYQQNKDLINVGAYVMGADPKIEEAIVMYPSLQKLIKQSMNQSVDWQQSIDNLTTTMQQPLPTMATEIQAPAIVSQQEVN